MICVQLQVHPRSAYDAPRNLVRGFGEIQTNVALRREFRLHNSLAMQFRAESFNVFNHPNFGYVDPTLSDATFGLATNDIRPKPWDRQFSVSTGRAPLHAVHGQDFLLDNHPALA